LFVSRSILEYFGYIYLSISLLFGYTFYYLSRDYNIYSFFMKCWVVLCVIGVPLGFLIPSGPRDFLGIPSTPSGGLYSVAILFCFLLAKIQKSFKWLILIPLLLFPFIINESFRYILQIAIFASVFLILKRPFSGVFVVMLVGIFLFEGLEVPKINEYFLSNWRIENYVVGINKVLDQGIDGASAFSRDGVNVRIGFIYEISKYLFEPQAIFGWGPNASYELMEKISGRFVYSHNSIVEFIISYGYCGLILFFACFFWRSSKYFLSSTSKKLWLAFVLSCLCVVFVNGKMYMLHSFWITYFSLKIFGENYIDA
jgi:hypothetical protein